MCDPVTLTVGLGLLAGGTTAQTVARRRREEEMNEAARGVYLLEQDRQRGYDRERRAAASQIFEETAGRDAVDEQMERAVAERMEAQRANAALPDSADAGYVSPAAGAEVSNVQERVAENRERTAREMEHRFGALARLRALGDAFQTFELFRQPLVSDINAVNSFSRQSAALAPQEAHAAAMAEADTGMMMELLGSIASGLGSAAIGAGAMGPATAASSAATNLPGAAEAAMSAGGAISPTVLSGYMMPATAANLFMYPSNTFARPGAHPGY